MRVSRIKWPTIKMKWEARKQSVAVFKGVKDYEEWAMSLTPPEIVDPFEEMRRAVEESEWLNPETYRMQEFAPSTGGSEKERLYNRAVMLRKQIDDAINNEDYEKAQLLDDTLQIIKKKYDEL